MEQSLDIESFDFNMKLDIDWKKFINKSIDLAPFPKLLKQGKLIYLINKFNWKERYLIEEDTNFKILHPLHFPEPARMFVKISKIETTSFTMEYIILSYINNVSTIISTGYSKMRLYDYKSKNYIVLNEEIRNSIYNFEPKLKRF